MTTVLKFQMEKNTQRIEFKRIAHIRARALAPQADQRKILFAVALSVNIIYVYVYANVSALCLYMIKAKWALKYLMYNVDGNTKILKKNWMHLLNDYPCKEWAKKQQQQRW